MQDFLIQRELAEVYLLLDNVASVNGKSLPKELSENSLVAGDEDWLEQICLIRWPVDPNTSRNRARMGAQLLRAKDALNRAASPATGASIAFTTLIANQPNSFDWLKSALSHSDRRNQQDGADALTLDSLAAQAFPTLADCAPFYGWYTRVLSLFLILWLCLTCAFSWDVATGSALLNRVNELQIQSASKSVQQGDVEVTSSAKTLDTATSESTGVVSQTAGIVGNSAKSDGGVTKSEIEARQRYANVSFNLKSWLDQNQWLRGALQSLMGGGKEASTFPIPDDPLERGSTTQPANGTAQNQANATPREIINFEWAAVFINILASTILPICYGVLGATASAVRNMSMKFRDYTLMPRDMILSAVQVALGAVIGACIGLFVSSNSGTGNSAGLIGSVHLSQSALCFVAGFGVEGVFQALEELVRRVFNIDREKTAGATAG